jgi:Cd2+/Zn2+-exporting ATPase
MSSDYRTTSSPVPRDDDTCVDALEQVVAGERGVVGVRLDTARERVSIDYDPALVSESDIVRIAQRAWPPLHSRWSTCTFRLQPEGGRSCEACALALEDRVRDLPGVRRATVSYLGGVLTVAYEDALTSPSQLEERIRGLGAPVITEAPAARVAAGWYARSGMRLADQRVEAGFAVATLAAMMLGYAADRLGAASVAGIVAYAVAYATGGTYGVRRAFASLRCRVLDIDLLMLLAAAGAWIVGEPFEGAMLLFLFSLSNVLQAFAMDRTRNAIRALMRLRPRQAAVKRDGEVVILPIEAVDLGETVLVRPGEALPLDGVVTGGESTVDQSAITGESVPVGKRQGDVVFAGTFNKNGSLEVRVTKLARDSTIARVIRLVEEAQSKKARTQRFIDHFGQKYTWAVLAFTAAVAVIPLAFLGEAFGTAFYRAITIMVAASPCALVISTPASILSGIGAGARRGVLFKGGVHLEQAAEIQVVAFDKTGTLTEGRPSLTDVTVLPAPDGDRSLSEDDVLALAAAVQARSEHALARATMHAATQRNLQLSESFAFQASTGRGVRGTVDGRQVAIGNLRFFEEFDCPALPQAAAEVGRLEDEGKTAVLVAQIDDGRLAKPLGVIAFADGIRPGAPSVVRELKAMGVRRVVMLTGDNERVASGIARRVGVDAYYAGLLPEDKVRLLKDLEADYGRVAMVGDGVNDAPALAAASVGIAMGAAGTDVALETADVVLMSDDLRNIPYAIDLSRQTRRVLFTNLGFAMTMIGAMIFGILVYGMSLPLAVVGHEGGTVVVSLNGLRLLAHGRRRNAARA